MDPSNQINWEIEKSIKIWFQNSRFSLLISFNKRLNIKCGELIHLNIIRICEYSRMVPSSPSVENLSIYKINYLWIFRDFSLPCQCVEPIYPNITVVFEYTKIVPSYVSVNKTCPYKHYYDLWICQDGSLICRCGVGDSLAI